MLAKIRTYLWLGVVVAAVSGCTPQQSNSVQVPHPAEQSQPTRQSQPAVTPAAPTPSVASDSSIATPAAPTPSIPSDSSIYVPYVVTSPKQCAFVDYTCVQGTVQRGNWAGAYAVAPWLRTLGPVDPWSLNHSIFVPYIMTKPKPCPFLDYSCVQQAVERGNWQQAQIIAPWLRKIGNVDPWDPADSMHYPPAPTTPAPAGTIDIAEYFFPRYSVRLTGAHPISVVREGADRVVIVKGTDSRNFETYVLTTVNGQEAIVLQQDNTAGIYYRFFGPGSTPTVWLPRYVVPGQTYSVPYEDNWMQRYDTACKPITKGSGHFGFAITVTMHDTVDFGGEMGKRKHIAELEYAYYGATGGTRKEIFFFDNEFGLLRWIQYDENGTIVAKNTFKHFSESPPVQPDLTALCS